MKGLGAAGWWLGAGGWDTTSYQLPATNYQLPFDSLSVIMLYSQSIVIPTNIF